MHSRLATPFTCLIMAFLGFVYLAWNIVKGLLAGSLVPGYASLIGVTVMLGGCQLTFIGLVGEYLARVFEEVKGRPTYLVKQFPGDRPSAKGRATGDSA